MLRCRHLHFGNENTHKFIRIIIMTKNYVMLNKNPKGRYRSPLLTSKQMTIINIHTGRYSASPRCEKEILYVLDRHKFVSRLLGRSCNFWKIVAMTPKILM